MNTHLHKSWFIILCFFLIQQNLWSQSTRSFTYGGSKGKNNGGKVKVEYLLDNGGRLQKLEGSVIDLNNYESKPKLIIRFSKLEIGLNEKRTKIKNSDHPRRYYMKIAHQSSGLLNLLGNRTINIGSEGSHYGKLTGQFVYNISTVSAQRKASIRIKTQIVDAANTGKRWRTVTINESITLLPKLLGRETIAWLSIKKLWKKFNKNPTTANKETLLEKCKEYLQNCEDGVFSCAKKEDISYYLTQITEGEQQKEHIEEYKTEFPKGKNKSKVEGTSTNIDIPEPDIPIEPGARVDFDTNYLVINNIKGGKMPYRLKFFKDKKQDSLPHNSYSFSKEYDYINLESLNVPEGAYTVVVTDSQGKEFVEKSGIHINKSFQIDPSIRMAGLLLLMGGAAFAYKKHIHF